MKVIVIIILILTIINTCLLLSKYHYQQTEGYFDTSNRTTTRVGPYDGITSCSSFGVRNVHDSNRSIGDDSFIFNGSKQNEMKENFKNNCLHNCKRCIIRGDIDGCKRLD